MVDSDNIKNVVEDVLRDDERARDSDKWLIIQVLRKLGIKIFIDYSQLKDMPSFETITRCRRFIQHDEGLYPASGEVEADRKLQEHKIKYGGLWANSQFS